MADLILSMMVSAMQLLIDLLPDSPIQDWLEGAALEGSAVLTGLGWLNWLVDISAMKIILGLWLVAVGIYYSTRFGLSIFGGLRNLAREIRNNLLS